MRHARLVWLATLLALPVAATAQEQELEPAPSALVADRAAAGLRAYMRLRFHQAEQHLRAVVEQAPSAAAYYYLAYTVYKIAEPKRPNDAGKRQAAELFARAYDLDPGFAPTWSVSDFGR
jgi:hypothetical protein